MSVWLRIFPLVLAGVSTLAAAARAEEFRSVYTVSYLGIPVASSDVTSRFDTDRFSIESKVSSSGLARLFDSTEASAEVSGRLADGEVRPDSYHLSYTSGFKKKRTTLRFGDGGVTEAENVPPLKKRKKGWVKLEQGDLKAVADPLSATVFRAGGLDEVCRRTLRVFDGEMRVDLKLSMKETTEWNGVPAVSCAVRFVPVAGYRKGKRAIEYLRDKSDIAITFTALGSTGLYAPVEASIGTEIGTVSVSASPAQPGD